MEFSKAFTLALGDIDKPVLTLYEIAITFYFLYKFKKYKKETITNIKKERADVNDLYRNLNKLINEGLLNEFRGFPSRSVYKLLGRKDESVEDIVCTVDPFCYVSHLSAMSFYGLTNRDPNKLFISTPSPTDWRKSALDIMEKDLGDEYLNYIESGFTLLRRNNFIKILRVEINRNNSLHLGAFRKVKDREMRVSTIGRTFLDMLRKPDLCSGMYHVLEVFDNNANNYIKVIVNEVDAHGNIIDKVRAGYILEERLGIKNDVIDKWLNVVQRGGSRKLDPSSEYIPVWSDKWCISINI